MKSTICLAGFLFFAVLLYGQTEMVINARPTQMGYSVTQDTKKIFPIVDNDVSGFLIKIKFAVNDFIQVELFRNGEPLENIYSNGFSSVKVNKKNFIVSCPYFKYNLLFHTSGIKEIEHEMKFNISLKKKKGSVSFHYPEDQKIFIYFLDLL